MMYETCFLFLLNCKCRLGAAIFFNAYPDIKDKRNWERRCGCIATIFCCKQQINRHPDGKTPPIKNIAELTAGLLSHCDLDASDLAAAIILTSAAQQRRRRLKIVSALVPLIEELQRNPDHRLGQQIQQCRQLMSRDSLGNWNEEVSVGSVDLEDRTIEGIPCDQGLTEKLERTQNNVRCSSMDVQEQQNLEVNEISGAGEESIQWNTVEDNIPSDTSTPTPALDQLADVVREELEQLGASPAGEAVLAVEQVMTQLS